MPQLAAALGAAPIDVQSAHPTLLQPTDAAVAARVASSFPVGTAPASASRRLLSAAARIAAAAQARATDDQVLGFTPRDFVLFGLPYRDPKTSLFTRRNGAITFTVTGGPHGVPCGQDRLLVVWLATVFKACGSPASNAIGFGSLRDIARALGKASSGQQRQRIELGLLRLFDATFLAVDARPTALRRERYQLMRRLRLWREAGVSRPNQHSSCPNVIELDPFFANDIRTGAIPIDFRSVVALSENMGALSLYQFEAYNSYLHARANRPAVPVLGEGGLLAQLGCGVSEADTRKARATIRHWHALVKRLWPDCPNELARGDTILLVRGGYAMKQGRLPAPEELGVMPLSQHFTEEHLPAGRLRPVVDRRRGELASGVLAEDRSVARAMEAAGAP